MPWRILPSTICVAGFRFVPIDLKNPGLVVGSDIGSTVGEALRPYVDQQGKPLDRCTIVLRQRHSVSWNILQNLWGRLSTAADISAMACLAEQRFLEGHFSPHLNATMFRLFKQGISQDSVVSLAGARGHQPSATPRQGTRPQINTEGTSEWTGSFLTTLRRAAEVLGRKIQMQLV
ncbi:MAG: hypothetical protein HQ481_21230 [Alphaproteobacteria bacterium]|nr:hypothetical protein [Alphaproteobacteria bacterium]